MKKLLSVILSLSLVLGGFTFTASKTVSADDENILGTHNRANYTWMTSNANNLNEGFCGIGSGFSNINAVNENLTNGNNMLGTTAATDEVAIYVNLGNNYDISSAKLYQGSTNADFFDSYCTNYSIYYSTEIVNSTNKGADSVMNWAKAGECTNGTIYSTAKIKNAADVSDTGDTITFDDTYTARSIKVVFDKDSCKGTGTNGNNTGKVGTISILSLRVYGTEHQEESSSEETQAPTQTPTTTVAPTQAPTQGPEQETIINNDGDENMYGSFSTNLAQGKNGYASSNDRQDKNYPVKVGNLTDGNTNSFIVTHSNDATPWFAVDLGSVQDINKIKVVPGGNDAYTAAYPISYEIQVSPQIPALGDDATSVAGLTWTTVKTVTGGTLASLDTTFAHQTTRWVRIKVNSQNTSNCSLFELNVYDTDKSKPYIEPTEATDVLFIGNSMTYYNNLPEVVERLAGMRNINLNCTAATNGGKNLIYQSTAANVDAAIKVGGYEVVVIQDIVGSFDADNLKTGADALIAKIKQYNPDAQIVFYEPWPVRNSLTGTNTLLPYFTHYYFKTANQAHASLAPAGEAFYEIFTEDVVDGYAGDDKHPTRYGTFISASTVLYTLFPELANGTYTSADQSTLDEALKVSAEATAGNLDTFDLSILNAIDDAGYKYAHAVATAMSANTDYTSVAGEYEDYEDEFNPDGLPAVQGNVVDASLFSEENGDIAIGKTAYASSTYNSSAANGVDGKTGTRWESTHGVDPQWFYIDFGTPTKFNTVGFIWEGAYAKQYVIQVSDDGENWTTVKYVTATSNKTVQIPLDQTYNKRYVRMAGFKRGTTYGYSFYEMGVWNTGGEEHTIVIDGEEVETMEDGDTFTVPSTYELGYMDANDNSKVYKPGTELTINDDLSLTAIKSVSVLTGTRGASVRLDKSAPGIAFEANAVVNGSKPIFSDAFTYGLVIAPEDIYWSEFSGDLVPTDDRTKAATIRIQDEEDFFDEDEGLYKAGIMNLKQFNYTRNFVARAFVEIGYADGSTAQVLSDQDSATRSLSGVSYTITQTPDYYNTLPSDQQEAATYFASFYN